MLARKIVNIAKHDDNLSFSSDTHQSSASERECNEIERSFIIGGSPRRSFNKHILGSRVNGIYFHV